MRGNKFLHNFFPSFLPQETFFLVPDNELTKMRCIKKEISKVILRSRPDYKEIQSPLLYCVKSIVMTLFEMIMVDGDFIWL